MSGKKCDAGEPLEKEEKLLSEAMILLKEDPKLREKYRKNLKKGQWVLILDKLSDNGLIYADYISERIMLVNYIASAMKREKNMSEKNW
ncbi:MAG: hypothetical protein HDR19_00025 [Lachnospiraceae bacterium]|nr:hypothetical protein [Lachnospiraceae bacterium]